MLKPLGISLLTCLLLTGPRVFSAGVLRSPPKEFVSESLAVERRLNDLPSELWIEVLRISPKARIDPPGIGFTSKASSLVERRASVVGSLNGDFVGQEFSSVLGKLRQSEWIQNSDYAGVPRTRIRVLTADRECIFQIHLWVERSAIFYRDNWYVLDKETVEGFWKVTLELMIDSMSGER